MRTRATLLFAAVGILLLPFLVSRYQDNQHRNSAPSALVAFAGHNMSTGAWCECGADGCSCDANETLQNHRTSPPNQPEDKPDDPSTPPTQGDPNLGPLALLVVLALLFWRFGR